MAEVTKRLVLLYHGAKEGRAAWFDLSHQAALAKAAIEPHYAVIEVEQAVLNEVDPDLAQGHLTNEGKPGKLPVMLRAAFDRLLALAEGTKAAAAPGVPPKPGGAAGPVPWCDLRIGSIVLASESKDDGWFECVVAAIEDKGQTLRLRWRDFPDYAVFTKPVTRVGLLPPTGLR